jgi:hypothetical protein
MKKIITFLLCVTFISNSCTKDKGKGSVVSTHMDISYQDKSGNDLLNPQTPGYYDASNIHVYKIVNGIKKEINNPMMDSPRDFFIYKEKEDSVYYLRIFLDNPTYLQLNQNTTDTMTCEIDHSNDNLILKKFWVNGKLYWIDIQGLQMITIVK